MTSVIQAQRVMQRRNLTSQYQESQWVGTPTGVEYSRQITRNVADCIWICAEVHYRCRLA